jgi:uncharacterized DUF497 family protein
MHYNFEWDSAKARCNFTKHGVTFNEAAEIFLDPLQITIEDDEHSQNEERWITLGNTKAQSLHLVVHTFMTYSKDEVTIRMISARPATRYERKQYEYG